MAPRADPELPHAAAYARTKTRGNHGADAAAQSGADPSGARRLLPACLINGLRPRSSYRSAGDKPSVNSIRVPHGSVMNVTFRRFEFGLERIGWSSLIPWAASLLANSSRFLTSKPMWSMERPAVAARRF